MIVVMHMSESGKEESKANTLRTTDDAFQNFASTKIYYRGTQSLCCSTNEKAAKEDIEKCISSRY